MAEYGDQGEVVPTGSKPKCDLCENEVDIQLSKCLECGVYICHNCRTAHKKLPATKHHRIICGAEKEPGSKLKPLGLCEKHSNMEVTFYCLTCKEFICTECIIGDHKSHDFVDIKTYAMQKRQKLEIELEKLKTIYIKKATSNIEVIEKKQKENDKQKDDNVKNISIRKLELISEVEKVNKTLITESETVHKSNKDKLTKAKTQLSQDLTELEKSYTEYNDVLHTGSDVEVMIVLAETETSQKLKTSSSDDIDTELHLPYFIAGKSDDKKIQTLYGSMKSGDTDQSHRDSLNSNSNP